MAMGADDSILVDCEDPLDALAYSQSILTAAIKREGDFSIIYAGKLAIDGNVSAVATYDGSTSRIFLMPQW